MLNLEKRQIEVERLIASWDMYQYTELSIPIEIVGIDFCDDISDTNQREIAKDIMQNLGVLNIETVMAAGFRLYIDTVFSVAFDLHKKAEQGTLCSGATWFKEYANEHNLLVPYMNYCMWRATDIPEFRYSILFDRHFFCKFKIDVRELVKQGEMGISEGETDR